jgi:hypothetical protein
MLSDATGISRDALRSGHSTVSLIVASLDSDDADLLPPQPEVTVLTIGTTKARITAIFMDDTSLLVVFINIFFLPTHRNSSTVNTQSKDIGNSNRAT